MINNFLIPEDSTRAANKHVVLAPGRGGEQPFREALLEKTFATHKRSPLDWAIAVAVHAAIVAAVVIIPLFFSQTIDLAHFQATYLVNPAPPSAPPPPPPPAAAAVHPQSAPRPHALVAHLFAPIAIPKAVAKPDASDAAPADAPPVGVVGGVVGGVPGGTLGGVLGGVLGSGSNQPAPPPVEQAAAAPTGPLHVGGNVKRPQPISQPQPEYPPLAKIARIQGVVDIDAVIDEHGNVVQAHVMDGPGLLIDAALKAVSQWKYQPTYLNGQPYPVDLVIQVTFSLS